MTYKFMLYFNLRTFRYENETWNLKSKSRVRSYVVENFTLRKIVFYTIYYYKWAHGKYFKKKGIIL